MADRPSADDELVRSCLAGEPRAWDAFVRRFGPLVYGIALRAGVSRDDAGDVFQTVFIAAWRNLHLLRRPGSVSFWLARVARRESWLAVRRLRPSWGAPVRDALETSSDALADAELERVERALLLRRALERLDPRCRRLLTRLFFEEPRPSYERIAAELAMPVGSLGPTRGRCLEKLRRLLDDRGMPE